MQVWFIDDKAENRATWLASFPPAVQEACELRVFASVPELLDAVAAGGRPDVVFVDFFLGDHNGLEVIERLTAGDFPRPLMIAHSTLSRANDAMLQAGAHLAMEKRRGVARTKSIVEAIAEPADLQRLIEEHGTGS